MIGPQKLPNGRVVLPGNRWDLAPAPADLPSVGVVIPYYNQPQQLSMVLDALLDQTYPLDLLDVVVADDGSAEPPTVADYRDRLCVHVVRQPDLGFRAAAARNLGARTSRGSILCFLDADTVPTPDYIVHAIALPAVAPDTVVVGRRRHADLAARTAAERASVLRGDWSLAGGSYEPEWLVQGYERTDNLLRPGWDGYRFVISAVLTCSRELFDDVGGFDERFVEYGGEDWEFANRAFTMGALLAHRRDAVAVHDGPDWAQRGIRERTSAKNREALRVASLVPDPAARTHGLHYRVPSCAAVVSTDAHTSATLLLTVASLLQTADVVVFLVGSNATELHESLHLGDSRIVAGDPSVEVLDRCRYVLHVVGRIVFGPDSFDRICGPITPDGVGQSTATFDDGEASVTMWSSRSRHRARRWARSVGRDPDELGAALFGVQSCRGADLGLVVLDEEPSLSW